MGRKAVAKQPIDIPRLKKPGMHFVGGVDGLALQILPSGGRSWILRLTVGSKRRDMGLGGFPDVTLTQARDAARIARAKVKEGIDPIEQARANQSKLRASQAAAQTFEQCAIAHIAAQAPSWKDKKSAAQWTNSLATYAFPHMGDLLVRDVDLTHVLAALEPIWTTKTETASRLRSRIEAVLDFATVRGYRPETLNPARWKGHLDKLLPAPGKVGNFGHHPALPYTQMGEFMVNLRKAEGQAARVLEFTILTAVRSGESRGTRWSEIDFDAALWVVPAERMKGPKETRKEHRVPLSRDAIKLLKAQTRIPDNDLVFPAARGGVLCDAAMSAVLRRMKVPAVPHGFRSTFRDWIADETKHPGEAAEMALAHKVPDKVEAAYRRGHMYMKRVKMMEDWAKRCATVKPAGVVVSIDTAKRA